MNAKEWAKDYLQRFEQKINELQQHSLVGNIVFKQYKGISVDELQDIQDELGCQLDDHIIEFFKLSNGLFLTWNSHVVISDLDETKIEKNVDYSEKILVATDENESNEAWISLLPLDAWISYKEYNIYGDPQDTSYGEDVVEKQGIFTYMDYYNFFYDVCIELNQNKPPQVIFGEDHSACYEKQHACDFVTYMEFILSTYGSVKLRAASLSTQPELNWEKIIEKKQYDKLPSLLSKNEYASIDEVIKFHFEEIGENYTELEHFESKSPEIYKQIEKLLDIVIKEEYL